jgi:K+-sensing histidine kinase KdpD
MNPRCEFTRETFHALAQPITALRVTVELALAKAAEEQAAHQALENCLPLLDHLMENLAVFREIASLDQEPPIDACDGQALLQSAAEEMTRVALASGIVLHLDTEPAVIVCHAPTLQRAIFVLLDDIIASPGRNCKISISLCRRGNEFLLEISPGPPPGLRQKLCRKLMQFAGGRAVASPTGIISTLFRECSSPQCQPTSTANKRLLISHSSASASKNVGVKHIS